MRYAIECYQGIIILLFAMFCFTALHDKMMTDDALNLGYYETNNFTNDVGTTFHFIILVVSVFLISIFSFYFIHPYFTIGFLMTINLIWIVNNIYSVMLLCNIL